MHKRIGRRNEVEALIARRLADPPDGNPAAGENRLMSMPRLGVLVAVLGAAALSIGAASSAGGTARHFVYEGTAVADRTTPIIVEIVRRDGENRHAELKAFNLERHCEDGSSYRDRLNPRELLFTGRNTFYDRTEELENIQLGLETLFEVKGRVMDDGTVRGYLRDKEEYSDPGPQGDPHGPDCSTGKVRWEAARRNPGPSRAGA